jgi:hypothetical protein
MLLEIEASSRHLTGVISRRTDFADVRPDAVDRARRRDADVSHKGCTAISSASHASLFVIDVRAGDLIELGVGFQRKPRPLRGKGTARAASPTVSRAKLGRSR